MSSLDSNDLECPHCGATFYYELTHCPNCGRNLYPDDEEPESDSDSWGVTPESLGSPRNTPPHPLTGILIGSVISSILGLLLFFLLNNLLSPAESPDRLTRFLPLLSVPLGAFIGGYIAIAINERHPLPSGLTVGLLSLAPAFLIIAYQHDLATERLFQPETLPWWIATLLAALLGSFLRHRAHQQTALRQLFKPRTETQLYTALLTKVQFDRPTAESLIAYEQKRAPTGTRFTWIQNAIDRWERDNRTLD
ncbi:MAG: hypothetical protein Fur0022_43430 [Anaerolineales bacterium]